MSAPVLDHGGIIEIIPPWLELGGIIIPPRLEQVKKAVFVNVKLVYACFISR
jgi:hypothetical protein